VDALTGAIPEDEGTGDLALLKRAQRLVLRYPAATQAAWAALIAEGRAYSKTPEGAELASALAGSKRLGELRRVLQFVTCRTLDDEPEGVLPSRYLDALLSAAGVAEMELELTRIHKPAP